MKMVLKSMAYLHAYNLSISFGEKKLFDNVSFEVGEHDRISLIAANRFCYASANRSTICVLPSIFVLNTAFRRYLLTVI